MTRRVNHQRVATQEEVAAFWIVVLSLVGIFAALFFLVGWLWTLLVFSCLMLWVGWRLAT